MAIAVLVALAPVGPMLPPLALGALAMLTIVGVAAFDTWVHVRMESEEAITEHGA